MLVCQIGPPGRGHLVQNERMCTINLEFRPIPVTLRGNVLVMPASRFNPKDLVEWLVVEACVDIGSDLERSNL